jgi:uncharacterized membrane protein
MRMKRHLQTLLAGVFVVVPFAITMWVIWTLGAWIGSMGKQLIFNLGLGKAIPDKYSWLIPLAGGVLLVLAIYFLGLLTRFYIFRRLLAFAERVVEHLPGVKTVYLSVRDLMRLFGTESARMGRVVLYRPAGSKIRALGILTNPHPVGVPENDPDKLVAVYFPLSYMIGGPILYVPRKDLEELDIPVEVAMKLSATAQVGGESLPGVPSQKK